MWTSFASNQPDRLAAGMAAEKPLASSSPMEPEICLVDHPALGQWLTLEIARRNGICANTRFLSTRAFVEELAEKRTDPTSRENLFSAGVMVWRILRHIGDIAQHGASEALRGYLQKASEKDSYRLAERITAIFEKYIVYRPDWIESWERGEMMGLGLEEDWQAELWRRLSTENRNDTPLRKHRRLFNELRDGPHRDGLPERITIFDSTFIPDEFLKILESLGRHIDIHSYIWTPTKVRETETPNRLLQSFGNARLAQIQRFMSSIDEEPRIEFIEPGAGTILHTIQSDIFNAFERTAESAKTLRTDDRSLQVHVCHSPMREVEVLHDQLLALFDRDPSLTPADVLVLFPDAGKYVPLIDAVFQPHEGAPHIPFSIVDHPASTPDPLHTAFLSILDLACSRFEVDRVMTPLQCAAVQRRFDLDFDALPLIERWLREAGVRWARDAEHKKELELPPTPQHTWRFGLDRMLLGFALPATCADKRSPLFSETLPYDDIEGGLGQVLGRFATYYETLRNAVSQLDTKKTPSEWADALHTLFDTMFLPDDDDESPARLILTSLDAFASDGERAGFDKPMMLAPLRSWLDDRLIVLQRRGPFPTGNVTFASFESAFPFPAKVVCVIGLNDEDFPRRPNGVSFDLMLRHSRAGDPSSRDDDRWSFLRAVCAARDVLYLSYVGADIRDNALMPPSVLLAELLDYIRGSFRMDSGVILEHVVVRHPLQAFSPAYFRGDERLISYSTTVCAAGCAAGLGTTGSRPLFTGLLPDAEPEFRTVDLDRLTRFYGNPVRYLLQRRFGIYIAREPESLEPREPFTLNYSEEQDLYKSLLSARLEKEPTIDLRALSAAAGKLPHGRLGDAVFAKAERAVTRFAGELKQLLPDSKLDPIPVKFETATMKLTGWLNDVTDQGLFGYEMDEVRPYHRVRLWIRHLALCLARPKGVPLVSQWVGYQKKNGKISIATYCEVEDAKILLQELLEQYWNGLHAPLPFFPKTSYAYADAKIQSKDALVVARKVWEPPDNRYAEYGSESEKPEYMLVYRGTDPLDRNFESVAMKLLSPLFEHQSEEKI